MTDHAGYGDVGPARRLANTISTTKTVLMALTGLGAIAGTAAADGGAAIIFLLYGVISIVSIYVMFGWFEHTLRLLVGIAFNTAEAADLEPGAQI